MHRILYCHHMTEISGGETSLLELFRNIDRERFQLLLAAPGEGPFPDAARALGVEVLPFTYSAIRRVDLVIRNALRLRRLARAHGADLLHANAPATNIPAALAGRMSGLPVIWHARTLVAPGEKDLDRLFLALPSLLISNSDAIRARFHRNGAPSPKTLTIINGVDLERFHPSVSGEDVRRRLGVGPDNLLVGVVARISPVKGQQTFVRAVALLARKRPDMRFLLVGSALFPGEKACEEEIHLFLETNGIEDRVIFSGYQSDVRAWTAALDICVIPSDAEGCGRVIFEAMAMEKPVVATNTGGTPEIAVDGETGLLVPPRNPGELAEAVERLAADPALRRRMGEAGRRRVEALFDIHEHARKTERAYLSLLEGRNGHG